MSFAIKVEGGAPIGMAIGDLNYDMGNILPYERTGTRRDPGVTRERIGPGSTDVTPRILQGRERWITVIGYGQNQGAFLTRVEPPANPNDPDDVAYANQQITEYLPGHIYTPADMVATVRPPSPKLRSPLLPPDPNPQMVTIEHMAEYVWFFPSDQQDPQDLAEPVPVESVSPPALSRR